MTEPMHLYDAVVLKEWVDFNGHMNDAAYAIPFSRAIDALMDQIGLDAEGRKVTNHTLFTLAMQLRFHHEVKEGAPLKVSGQILEIDAKRLRLYQWLRHGETGALLATSVAAQNAAWPGKPVRLIIGIGPANNETALPWLGFAAGYTW